MNVKYSSHLFSMVLALLVLLGLSQHAAASQYRISGPYSKHNLSLYLIHGADQVKDQTYLTLGDAMKEKKVKVHETSNVNQLSIENTSKTEHIYIQAGDIVKGGKQDRVFSTDMVLEPGSGKVNIASFCVEQGRWNKRGAESSKVFNSSSKNLSSKELRLAARLKKNQSEVWSEVEKAQRKLSKKIGQDIKAKASASSLQLALENKKLAGEISDYKKKYIPLLKDKKSVIGYAFSINGKLNTADIYANESLFRKLWPKIVDSAATESLAEYDKGLKYNTPKPAAIQEWMSEAKKGKQSTQDLKPGLKQDTVENESDVRFDTYSGSGDNKKLYRQNFIKK